MSKPLMSLCYIPRIATRDGHTGGNAKMLLPFYGYWFASGQIYSWPNSQIPQDLSKTISGTNMSGTFQKDCCSC